MAKTSYLSANIGATDSFAGWIDKTNAVRDDMGNIVVTVTQVSGEPSTVNAGLTTGNLAIVGVVTANTFAVATALRGGTVTVPADLTITSNTLFSTPGNVDITGANTVNINSNNTIVTSNLTFNATSKFIKIDANTVTVNTGAVTISSNTTFAGPFVYITSVNTTIGDAGTDVLNVNAISDFNANVNIDGVITATANATFSGALFNITGNTVIGDSASVDRLTVTAALASDLIPTTNAINLGSTANNYGNVFTTYVYAANNIQTSNQLVLNGAGTRTLKTLDPTASALPGTFNLVVANNTVSTTALVANTTGIFASANITYDLGSAAVSWKSLFVKDLTVVSNTVTANLTVSNLTSGRVPLVSTGGLVVDSANLAFTGTVLNVIGSANVSVNANVGGTLGVVGVATFSANVTASATANINVLGVTTTANVGGTLGVVGVATFSANVSSAGTANVSTLGVTNNANVGGTLGVVGNTTLSANLAIAANKYLNLGPGPDLQLYSDGTNSYIKEYVAGFLSIDASQLNIVSSNTTVIENMATFVRQGAVTLYYANSKMFETLSTGVQVTGNTTITGNLVVQGSTTLASTATLALNTSTTNTMTVFQVLTSSGNTIIGNVSNDVIQFVASANSSLVPAANNTYNLGSTNYYWNNVYSANVTSLIVNGNTVNSNTVYANTAVSYLYHVEQSQQVTLTTAVPSLVASFPIASFSAAELLICATQGSARHISKILLTHNGTTAYATEYGTILTGSSLVTYDVDVNGGNVRFLATLASATSTVFNTALTLIKI